MREWCDMGLSDDEMRRIEAEARAKGIPLLTYLQQLTDEAERDLIEAEAEAASVEAEKMRERVKMSATLQQFADEEDDPEIERRLRELAEDWLDPRNPVVRRPDAE